MPAGPRALGGQRRAWGPGRLRAGDGRLGYLRTQHAEPRGAEASRQRVPGVAQQEGEAVA